MADVGEMLIGQPELSELLMRALFLKSDLPQYVGTPYAPTFQVTDLTAPEYMHLRRWRRFMGRISQAPVAANFSIACFGTPNADRTVMAVIEQVYLRTTAVQPIRFGVDGDLFTLGTSVPASTGFLAQDDRSATLSAGGSSHFGMSFTNQVTSPFSGTAPEVVSGGTTTVFLPIDPSRPIILTNKPINNTGKSYFYVAPTAVNVGMDLVVFWRERPLLETEL